MTNNGDAVEISIKERVEGAEAPRATECCIFKVPVTIRRHNKEAYTPKVVSIGPFHKGHPPLKDMERQKLFYCKAFLQRTQTPWDSWIGKIVEMEPMFRRCYSDTLEEFSKEQLVEIMLVDCAFILELFCRFSNGEWIEDMCLSKPWLRMSIIYDLLLLENQVPFFVLQRLFNDSCSSRGGDFRSFLELTFHFFQQFNRSKLKFNNINPIRHFTDLVRTFHLPDPLQPRPPGETMTHLPSATELSEAGLRFKVPESDQSCLLNIKLSGRFVESESCLLKTVFSGGVLEIPQLVVDDWTETLFRNMVALEQCLYPSETYITDYVDFLDFLVNTNRDVDILVQARVFVNWLGDTHSVATMINGLMKNITVSNNISSHYLSVVKKLTVFHKNPCRKLKSSLRRDYCRGPWQTAASTAAIILLLLTIGQTVCSILQVIHPQIMSQALSQRPAGVETD